MRHSPAPLPSPNFARLDHGASLSMKESTNQLAWTALKFSRPYGTEFANVSGHGRRARISMLHGNATAPAQEDKLLRRVEFLAVQMILKLLGRDRPAVVIHIA